MYVQHNSTMTWRREIGVSRIWSELRADARVYETLGFPPGTPWLRRALAKLRSRGLLVLAIHRLGRYHAGLPKHCAGQAGALFIRVLLAIGRRLAIAVAKSDIAPETEIGAGVCLSDRGYLILGPQRIGSGTLIHDRVTIGVRAGETQRPVIGERVWIGPGCVLYGGIIVGNGVTVLPDSVLSMNVADNAVVGGNPASIVRQNFDNRTLRGSLSIEIDRKRLAQP